MRTLQEIRTVALPRADPSAEDMDDGLPQLLAKAEVTTWIPIWRHPKGESAQPQGLTPHVTTTPLPR